MKKLCLITTLLILRGLAQAQDSPEQIFQAANQAYDQKEYLTAVEKYESLLKAGVISSAVYYNLGSSHFRVGNLGKATLYYRQALKLNPGDQDTRDNLEFTRLYQMDKISPKKTFFFLSALASLPDGLGLGLLSWVVVIFWWLVCLLLLLFLVYKRRSRVVKAALVTCLVLFIFLGSSLRSGLKAEQKTLAVVLANEVEAKSGPGDDYVSLFTVHQGLECEVAEQRGEWYLISLANGSKAWVPVKTLGLV